MKLTLNDMAWLMLALSVVLFAVFYVREVKARAGAEAFARAKQEQIDALERRKAERAAAFQAELAQLEKEMAEVRTQKQAVRVIERYIPAAQPITEVTREEIETAAPELAEHLPDAPSYSIVTEATLVEFARHTVQCRMDQLALKKCAADLADTEGQYAAAVAQREAWTQAAKGGSWARRAGRTGMLGGCAAGGAAIGAQKDAGAAAVGALAGVALCALLAK